MWSRAVRLLCFFGAPVMLVGVAFFGGCNDDPTHFGPAGGLAGRTPDDQAPPAVDAGSSGTSGGEAGACLPGTPDAGCPSFATDIFTPMFAVAGTYKCGNGVGCHGVGGSAPAGMVDAPTTYTLLTGYTSATLKNVPYVNLKCGDPAQSSIICNTAATGTCGTRMPSGGQIAEADLTKIKAWIACGAPK